MIFIELTLLRTDLGSEADSFLFSTARVSSIA